MLTDFLLMADSKPLCSRDGDPMAAEALLRDVFGIIVDEVIRKGTSASEKVGPAPSSRPRARLSARLLPQGFTPEFITVSPCASGPRPGSSCVCWPWFPSCLGGSASALSADAHGWGSHGVGGVPRPRTSSPAPSRQVCEWKEPEELKQLLDLELRNQGEASEQILARCRAVVRYSVKTCGCRAAGGSGLGAAWRSAPAPSPGHPRFFNQLFSGWDPHALAGRIVTESLNTSQ